MSEQNVNGTSSQVEKVKQFDERAYQQFNGVHSSQSSRSSSPSVRLGQIPSSQLPPQRQIPQSQLPPSRSPITSVTHQIGGLNIGQNPKFSTSTPNLQNPANFVQNIGISPLAPKQLLEAQSNISRDNLPSAVPNFRPSLQQTPKNVIPVIQDSLNQSSTTPQQRLGQINNVNGPISQNQHVSSASPVFNHFTQQKIDSQNIMQKPAFSYNPPINQVSSVSMQSLPNQRYPTNSMLNPPDLQRTPLQTSPINKNDFNQRTIGSVNSQNDPAALNMNKFKTNVLPQPKMSPSINSNVPPNSFRPPNLQPAAPTPMMYPQNVAQTNYNGPPSSVAPVQQLANQKPHLLSNRYPIPSSSAIPSQITGQQQQYPSAYQQQQPPYNFQQPPSQQNMNPLQQQNNYVNQQTYQSVPQAGFNKLWGTENYDLLQTPNILPPTKVEAPMTYLGQEALDQANCSSDIFRCTMTKIPENNSLLQKSRLPLGVLIHPFRDLSHLPVIQCSVIVRCRACRTYINPFVMFVDNKRWKCNLCYRINELPEEFQYDPVTKTYGDPSRRPEIKSSTLEYIAPAEYMLRPPQPAVYLYLLDVSRLAITSGYLNMVSDILLDELKNLPGDARTHIGFIAFDSAIHFYSLPEGITQPQEMTVLDIDDVFLPTPDNLLVNLKDRMELIADLLTQLPNRYANTFDTNSALGAALQVAFKMMSSTGGRVTVFQASLPNVGPGALTTREDPSQRASTEVAHLNPINDFYKRLALECSGQQIAVDLFIINSQYVDIATISGISRFSGGCIHHFPLLKISNTLLCESFTRCFRRYLTRKIGFEAVMRIRCTRGLSIHTFHGNFFVRSTDLLSLPNINPDAGFGMQVAIEENLSDVQSVCFQAALLYTSSKGERRIRVHTICLPIASTLQDVIHSADQQCIIGLLSKMAVDRSMQSSLSDAREAFINVAIDILSSYKMSLNLGSATSGLLAPNCLRLLALYISALLKHMAFRIGSSTRLDDRVMAMIDMKTKPLYMQMQQIYPDLYPIHELENQQIILNSEEEPIPMPPRIQLTARCLENKGAFLMDMGTHMVVLICPNVSLDFLNEALGVPSYNAISDEMYEIPILDNLRNQRLHHFINYLNEDKPYMATIQVIRDNSTNRVVFFERLIEDRVENALSYHEFLQHLKTQVK